MYRQRIHQIDLKPFQLIFIIFSGEKAFSTLSYGWLWAGLYFILVSNIISFFFLSFILVSSIISSSLPSHSNDTLHWTVDWPLLHLDEHHYPPSLPHHHHCHHDHRRHQKCHHLQPSQVIIVGVTSLFGYIEVITSTLVSIKPSYSRWGLHVKMWKWKRLEDVLWWHWSSPFSSQIQASDCLFCARGSIPPWPCARHSGLKLFINGPMTVWWGSYWSWDQYSLSDLHQNYDASPLCNKCFKNENYDALWWQWSW